MIYEGGPGVDQTHETGGGISRLSDSAGNRCSAGPGGLEAARVTYDNAERKKLYSQANVLILDDSPVVFSQHRPEVKVMSPKLQGFIHVPDGMIRLWNVWMAK